ncbi:NADPH--cytochrome reductase [Halobacillus halophilus]|uniref:Bifunctional cytochrome P450/NADPH--P450 reductase n=1 Tax=Halobacillus halophilus (strain ATCC 35676 / DSM 2266 / JCM 20832 / KCTC 3685 / LMG 17431 / NBRC 102448 / NCIMB 2269) TaxID=866895 RepID=I0JHR8_HALH3|nr:cytochrome P450 [Halobacillus halophilus]ASF37892.1 NADPH--cytochrome reductase [Halobacillus halophilus]CCG43686.1 NADPH--cytochrome P450 oxidoreductase [Halobacillus halophilus DSM 2266]
MEKTNHLPQPKSYGPLGNLPLINKEKPIQSFMKLADEFGPLYQFQFPGRTSRFVSSAQFAAEICDESRFDKKVGPALQKVRAFGGDGLFTSETEEINWKKAHNILLPSFSQQAMKGYHNKMVDLASQLIQKWARLNPNEEVEVPEDMTRLTLDTIGLCGFNYRFNSFYRERSHPFVEKMVHALDESMSQTQRFELQDKLMIRTKKQYKEDIEYMFNLVDQLIAERKETGDQGEDDLLAHMLKGKDPETGEALDDENIRFQIITFLIAGHETTSGLLSFAIHYLMKNPDKLKKAQEEVDEVIGEDIPSYKQVKKLKYVRMILNEALRLWPTAPAFSVYAKENTTLAGQYEVEKGETFTLLLPQLHRDTSIWGEDAEAFKPERFEDPSQIPRHAYKPFGNGQRACIGQQFALHEATLVLGMVLQYFDFEDHTNYQLDVKEALTMKPEGLTMRVKSRRDAALMQPAPAQKEAEKSSKTEAQSVPDAHLTPLLVLYGSNMGTAEGVARELAQTGKLQGFDVKTAPLNQYTSALPAEGAVLIVSASYNGNPPDNADAFVRWLKEADGEEAKGVSYAVFGCGDRNWASTYQRVPTLIDEELQALGAERILAREGGDASEDFEGDLEKWEAALWPALADTFNLELEEADDPSSHVSMEFVSGVTQTPLARTHHAFTAMVNENRELQVSSERSTRHLELKLPEGVNYQEGDHLGVLPQNGTELVERVLRRFQLKGEEYVVLGEDTGKATHLPTSQPISLRELLTSYVELQEPATRSQIRDLAAHNPCPPHKMELEKLLEDETYKNEILAHRLTMLDLLEDYLSCEVPFERFLALLPPLKARYYSISSSPRKHSEEASVTVSVVKDTAWSGRGEFKGTASNYMANRDIGDKVACFINTPQSNFTLPENPETPMVWIGPGTGIAPFRGFIQARENLLEEGHRLGEAHLYFGCRHPEKDFLYKNELEKAADKGLITLHTAFSRIEGKGKVYVQDRLWEDASTVLSLLENGGCLYICGDGSEMAPAVIEKIIKSYQHKYETTYEKAVEWLENLELEGRLAKDVWAGA